MNFYLITTLLKDITFYLIPQAMAWQLNCLFLSTLGLQTKYSIWISAQVKLIGLAPGGKSALEHTCTNLYYKICMFMNTEESHNAALAFISCVLQQILLTPPRLSFLKYKMGQCQDWKK